MAKRKYRVCVECGADITNRHGLAKTCGTKCFAEYRRKYHMVWCMDNRGKRLAWTKRWQKNNPEVVRANNNAYVAAHRDKVNEYQRAYYHRRKAKA